MNVFAGLGIKELLAHRERIRNRIIGGQRTAVALAPGMRDEYADKSESDLRRLFREVCAALYALDPETYEDPDVSERPGQSIPIFC